MQCNALNTRVNAPLSLLILILLGWLQGCASLQPGFENPTVSISSFSLLPASGMVPKFGIGLHVINPNRTPLSLQGLVYTVEIDGHKLLTGVANDLPEIAAYGEGDIQLQASADLLSGLGLFTDLIRKQRHSVEYNLTARINISQLLPDIIVSEHGQIDLSSALAR